MAIGQYGERADHPQVDHTKISPRKTGSAHIRAKQQKTKTLQDVKRQGNVIKAPRHKRRVIRSISCQMACKPGSVSRLHDAEGDDHSSSAGCCQPPQATYPDISAGSHQPHAACVPTWSCSGWGLPCPACYQPGGALLPHLFTLTSIRPVGRMGGLFSAALSLGSPPPGVTRHPDPVEPGLSSPFARTKAAAIRSSDSSRLYAGFTAMVKQPRRSCH